MSNEDKLAKLGNATPAENVADILSAVVSYFGPLGGPVSVILSGATSSRKVKRVADAVRELAQNFEREKEKISEEYVKGEDFEELLEEAIKRIAGERSKAKVKLYKNLLLRAAKEASPDLFDEQLKFLKVIEGLELEHVYVLWAIANTPDRYVPDVMSSSRLGTLQQRLPQLSERNILFALEQMQNMLLVKASHVSQTIGLENTRDLTPLLTSFGRGLVDYLRG